MQEAFDDEVQKHAKISVDRIIGKLDEADKKVLDAYKAEATQYMRDKLDHVFKSEFDAQRKALDKTLTEMVKAEIAKKVKQHVAKLDISGNDAIIFEGQELPKRYQDGYELVHGKSFVGKSNYWPSTVNTARDAGNYMRAEAKGRCANAALDYGKKMNADLILIVSSLDYDPGLDKTGMFSRAIISAEFYKKK